MDEDNMDQEGRLRWKNLTRVKDKGGLCTRGHHTPPDFQAITVRQMGRTDCPGNQALRRGPRCKEDNQHQPAVEELGMTSVESREISRQDWRGLQNQSGCWEKQKEAKRKKRPTVMRISKGQGADWPSGKTPWALRRFEANGQEAAEEHPVGRVGWAWVAFRVYIKKLMNSKSLSQLAHMGGHVRPDVYWGYAQVGKVGQGISWGMSPNAHQIKLGGGLLGHMIKYD